MLRQAAVPSNRPPAQSQKTSVAPRRGVIRKRRRKKAGKMINASVQGNQMPQENEQLIGQEQNPEPAYNPPGFRFAELRNEISDLLQKSREASDQDLKDIYRELNIKCIRIARVCVDLW